MVPAGAHGPVGKIRNPMMTCLSGMVCFVLAIVSLLQMIKELNAFRQRDPINPIFLFVPILNILTIWGLPAKVLEAKQMAGVPNATVASPIMYLVLGLYFFPKDLNEAFEAAGGAAPAGPMMPGLPPGGMQ